MASQSETKAESSGWFLSRLYHTEYKIIRIPKEGQLTLGSGKNANFLFSPVKYPTVSSEHCSLQMIDGKPTVTDCQSQKGTYVNYTRFDMFAPGRSDLQEGNLVGFGISNGQIPQYYKSHDDELLYRVCREVNVDEAIVISDDEKEQDVMPQEDVKPAVLLVKQEPAASIPDKPEPEPFSSGIYQPTLCVSIPEELLRKSSFEEEYDQYVDGCHTSQGYESDTEQCSPNDSNVVIILSDDEYTDQHYSQMVLEEIKQELDEEEQTLPEREEEDEPVEGWAYKLKSDADATSRYKPRLKEKSESSKHKHHKHNSGAKWDIVDGKRNEAETKKSRRNSISEEQKELHLLDDENKSKGETKKPRRDSISKDRNKQQHLVNGARSEGETSKLPGESISKEPKQQQPLFEPDASTTKMVSMSRRNSTTDRDTTAGDRRSFVDEPAARAMDDIKQPTPKAPMKRRNSVVDWTVIGAKKTGGVIEIAPPEPSVHTVVEKNVSMFNGSVTSVSVANQVIQKKLKRRYSVSDRNNLDAKPADTLSKDQKEQRKNRLLELAEKQKNQEAHQAQPVTTDDGISSLAPKKTFSSTKPKVKFTPHNRGVFLTAPVPPPSSRVSSTSRPTSTDESIMCTQSTALEQLPVGDENELIDMRPKKLTFQSVAKVSNVDRPMPAVVSGVHKIPSQVRPAAKHEAVIQQKTSSSSKTSMQSQTKPTKVAPQTAVPSKVTAGGTKTVTKKPPQKPPCKVPCKSILKKYDIGQTRVTSSKRVTIAEELNRTWEISRYIEPDTVAETSADPASILQTIIQREQDVLAEILEWRTALLMTTGTELSGNVSDGPFASEGRMLQNVESYDTYELFRAIHLPFLKRELWMDLLVNSRALLPLFVLQKVNVNRLTHPKLCKITCDVYARQHGNEQFPSCDFGILEYYSSLNHTHSLFASIRHHIRGTNPVSYGKKSFNTAPTQLYHLTLFAAERELEGLRTGKNFFFRPITRIQVNLRLNTALTMLEFSPLLPNILSPASNKATVLKIAKTADSETRKSIEQHLTAGSLNPSQLDVVAAVLDECRCWAEPSISIIQGPPGTGKSRVISHLVLELLKSSQPKPHDRMKVLVCASSNTAVDVIVKNLIKLQQRIAEQDRIKLVRTGTRNKIDAECIPVFIDKLVQDEVTRENQQSALTEPSLVGTYEREKYILGQRIKITKAELAKGSNVNVEHLRDMERRHQSLEELLHPGSTSEGRKEQEIAARTRILRQADIICTTLGSCSTLGLHCTNLTFSVCVIDEATQCTELCTLAPLQYGVAKLVLVGDINQLPATVLDQQSIEAGFRMSLFSRLYQSYIGSSDEQAGLKMLTMQYRMHPEICHWPNHYFYSAQLRHAHCTEMMRKQIPLQPYMVVSLSYDQELTQAQHEIYNRDEIEFVVGLMREVVKCCDKLATFAIITPYARHKEELATSLRNYRLPQVEVHSIDSVQGKEYDVVIISLARSNGAGFLNNPERINVAMTRAKQCLVLCGNFASLQHKPVWSALLKDAENRRVFFHLEEHDAAEDGHTMVKNIMERLRKKT
uniref:FHA domain-containing protein n=1 Tax=Anopheles dirus TaxID=7168 RepID=A0A182N8B4_9DIPT